VTASIIAVYPGTFDPITNGHTDLIHRAARLTERLIVAVAENPNKQPYFTLTERTEMARGAVRSLELEHIEVRSFRGLLIHFAQEMGARVLIRGLRAVSDFEHELQLAEMNRRLDPRIETLFLSPAAEYAVVSSSLVRELAALGGDVSPFVHHRVEAELKRRMG